MEAAGATVGKEKRGDLRAPQGSKGSDVRHPSGRSGARRGCAARTPGQEPPQGSGETELRVRAHTALGGLARMSSQAGTQRLQPGPLVSAQEDIWGLSCPISTPLPTLPT